MKATKDYTVKVYDVVAAKCTCEESFSTSEAAYDFYCECIRLEREFAKKGEHFLVARFFHDYVMAAEETYGTN